MKIATLMAMSIFAVLTVTSAFGQVAPQRVNISFQFTVGKKVFPPGQYEVAHEKESTPFVTIRGANGKSAMQVKVITLLARENSSENTMRLVFDKVGDAQVLSEVWIPGQQGLLVHLTKGGHQHQTVGP
jgi:hypothetical protein